VRLLAVLAVAAYLFAAFLPVLLSRGYLDGPRIRYTTLGESGPSPSTDPVYVVLWLLVIAAAGTVCALPRSRVCALVPLVVAGVLLVFWGSLVADPPRLMWDGQDADGEWIGGMEVGEPHVGAALVAASVLLFAASGARGLLAARTQVPHG